MLPERAEAMVERVRVWLQWPIDAMPRLLALPATDRTFTLPTPAEAFATLRRMDVPPHAATEMVEAMPTPEADPEAWWLLERLYGAVVDGTMSPPWPAPVVGDDALSRFFHLYVFLAAVPDVLRMHAHRGVPSEITWETLGDVGLQVAHHESRHGRPGFDGAFWVWEHFRGDVFRLGRLMFNRTTVEIAPGQGPVHALAVHIPALGPMTPAACDASFELARSFYRRYFPSRGYRVATCRSWLMDPQLADHLAPDSNIVRFQKRFTLVPGWSKVGDDDVIRFVFGKLPATLDDLPRRTSLECAVVDHLRAGRHWHLRQGWFELA